MKLLTPYQVADITGLPYAKALMLIKAMAYIQIGNRYYVSDTNLAAFLSQDCAVEITNEEN